MNCPYYEIRVYSHYFLCNMQCPFTYMRTIHFRDTDAAGVVYFANGLAICHEAYEASLAASGIDLKIFFGGSAIAAPITHASINFFKPMFCGDRLEIELIPSLLSEDSFQIEYQICCNPQSSTDRKDLKNLKDLENPEIEVKTKKAIAQAITRHTCIDSHSRKKCNLSTDLLRWISSLS